MLDDDPPASLRGVVLGRTGSGKSQYCRRVWFPMFPRLVILDQTGEWRDIERENGGRVVGIGALVATIQARAGQRRWTIVADLTNSEIEELVRILIPRGAVDKSPARLLGGMALFIDEVDQVVPINAPEELRTLFRRGRHVGLSVIAATQRPSNVSKEVTSQAQFIAVLALHERNDVAYLRQVMGTDVANDCLDWANSAPYRVAFYSPRTGAWVPQEPI